MKKVFDIIILISILINFSGCTKLDLTRREPIPSLNIIDISGAKFLLCNRHSIDSNTKDYSFSKISAGGIETDASLLDENNNPIDLRKVLYASLTFSSDEYFGLGIAWRTNYLGRYVNNSDTQIFYLIQKRDGKIVVEWDVTGIQSSILAGRHFRFDSNGLLHYLLNGSLIRLAWNKYNPKDFKYELIDSNVESYILAPNGDLAYMRLVNSYPKYFFKFSDGSKMEFKSPWSHDESIYKSSGIYELGITSNGKFCAYFKNPDSNICEMRILYELNGHKDFYFCNTVEKPIDEFHLVGGKLWGLYRSTNYNLKFMNLTDCGKRIDYNDFFYCKDIEGLRYSYNYFYYHQEGTNLYYRFLPGSLDPAIWVTFPGEQDIYYSSSEFSRDEYSIFRAHYHGNVTYFFLDMDGKIIAERDGTIVHSSVVL